MRFTKLLSTTALVCASFVCVSPSLAQNLPDADQPQPTTETEIESGTSATGEDGIANESIVVTGTRIRRPNLVSAVPITSIGGEEFFETGNISIGDVLNELPQLRSTFSQSNGTRFLGTGGLNLLDLRGLGSERTLVLVNGRRHVGGDILSTGTSPDTNTFPTDLVDRVDLITGGGSSIYGSDAIAGVVNFILKQDFDGVQLRAQAGVSGYGDAGNQYVSVLAGKNFADGRGNIAVNLEYARQDEYFASGRPDFRSVDGFLVVDTDPAGTANGSDGNPDRVYFRDIRSTTARGGTILVRQPVTGNASGLDSTGAAFTLGSLFLEDGSLVPQTGTRVGIAPNGTYIGGNAVTGREGRLLSLSPQLDRYSVNLIGHFDISPALVPFVEAKYVRSESSGSQSGPFFSQGQTIGDGIIVPGFVDRSYVNTGGGTVNREGIRLDNPFLSAPARATITAQLAAAVAGGVNPNTGAVYGTTPAAVAARARAAQQVQDQSFRFNLRKNYLEFGTRLEEFKRETYRVVAGIRGDFFDDWNYEISGNYGELREKNAINGNINTQRFLLAVDSVRNPATGQIVCRSQIDPNYRGPDAGDNPAVLAADIAACVPLNPFGEGVSSQAVRDYLTVNSLATGKITQIVGSAFVAGDFSKLFELPGGPVGFSVGAEYRRDTLDYDLDDLTQNGYAFYNAIPTFDAPAAEVKEVYGELSVPLLKDVPFFRELTLSASGRLSDYKGATGTVYSYGGDVVWRPIEPLRLRGSYNRAVRAPNLSERFSAQSQNFALPGDPCAARNLATGSATRAANCTAAGRPANFDFTFAQSLEIRSGGNPDLQEETSDNYTIGGVFTPSFIPGLSISADYFQITVNDVITSISAQQILNSCYDAASLDNVFCASFERAGAGGGPRGEQEFQILEGSLLASTLNFAKLKFRGIDSELAYRRKLGDATLGLRAVWTHVFQNDEFTNPAEPGRINRVIRELGDPQDEINVNANVKLGKVTFGYQFRFIEKQYVNTYEDFNSVQGRPPENADYADIKFYPNVYYSDVRLDLEANKQFNLYLGVDNVANRLPPLGVTGVGGGSGIYDNRGRTFYVGAKASF